MYKALDSSTHDLIRGATVTEGRYTVQLVKCKLLAKLGEWSLDPTIGWISLAEHTTNPDLFDLELRATNIILSTVGVLSVDEMTLKLMSDRTLKLDFKATTIYGTISLTIPW